MLLIKTLGGTRTISLSPNTTKTTREHTHTRMTIATQLEMFPDMEITEARIAQGIHTTLKDLIRELVAVSVEVDIALDEVIDQDLEKAQKTLEELQERIEEFVNNIQY